MKKTSALLALLVLLGGCSSFQRYMEERGKDFLDIFDVKLACPETVGLGIKIQFTDYFACGLGVGWAGSTCEKYGRYWTKDDFSIFLHVPLFGVDGGIFGPHEAYFLGVYPFWAGEQEFIAPWYDRFRFGFELFLPFVNVGLYINGGQVIDFLLGWFGIDYIYDTTHPARVHSTDLENRP